MDALSRIETWLAAMACIISFFGSAAAAEATSELTSLEASNHGRVGALSSSVRTFREPASRDIAEMIFAASSLEDDRVRASLARYRMRGDKNPRREALAWSVAANSAFTSGDYRTATVDADEWIRWLAIAHSPSPGSAIDAANLKSTAASLSPLPPQRLVEQSPRAVSISRDRAGLLRADATVDGQVQSVVLDTGANVSTISLSAARKLGLHIADSEASVGSGTRAAGKHAHRICRRCRGCWRPVGQRGLPGAR